MLRLVEAIQNDVIKYKIKLSKFIALTSLYVPE